MAHRHESGGGIACRALLCALVIASGCRSRDERAVEPPPSGTGANAAKATEPPLARAVTAEIARGIEHHIKEKSLADGGRFVLTHEGKTLRLELVRVHLEYLASLGPERNFACVDLVDTDGEVYDVDFFMDGPKDDMRVTETTVHKVNGRPIYAWEQKVDKTWHRVPMEGASAKLQDVIEGKDAFEFVYRVKIPKLDDAARMWLPIPVSDAFQTVTTLAVDAPGTRTMLDDAANANRVMMLDLSPADSDAQIEMRFHVSRVEKAATPAPLDDKARFLQPDILIPLTDELRANAESAIAGKQTDIMRARALYDHVMDRMSYKKVGEGWGEGNATYACDSRSGNCSDYHSYFIAIARSVGIPARFAVGAAIPATRDDGDISGYHCWAEFYADGKWWPVDVSEGDKYTNLSTYYFGHHPANRIELSRGRDLVLDPGPVSGPINFLAHPVLEVGGKNVRVKAGFSFERRASM
jgi:transglutaminase-like putative cysteine protease